MSKALTALGLMSGTSLDGIDVALLETDGETILRHGPNLTVPYDDAQRQLLRQGLLDAKSIQDRADRPGNLAMLELQTTEWHIAAVQSFAEKFSVSLSNIDIIGFHGQTVLHRPDAALTVQLGLGGQLASALGVPVAYDLRAFDMANGGQGAPLVPVYHRALVAGMNNLPVAVVNIGGVANVTWIGGDGALVAFDTGPGNALIDDWVKQHTGASRDDGGQLALQGSAKKSFVDEVLRDSYFDLRGPKSLDRNHFTSYAPRGLSLEDGAATWVQVTAGSIAASIENMPSPPQAWVICGGGRHNAAIMQALRAVLPRVFAAEDLGFSGDAIEAEAWAFLAVRSLRQLPLTYPATTGVRKAVSGGVIVKPT